MEPISSNKLKASVLAGSVRMKAWSSGSVFVFAAASPPSRMSAAPINGPRQPRGHGAREGIESLERGRTTMLD